MPNLAKLPLKTDDGLVRVVIETPMGSRQKIDYDARRRCFFVKRRMPLGVAYPFHFGFLPSTHGEDGDPLDAIVLHDQSAFPGLVLNCRIIGALKLSQTEEGKTVRNDRFMAVPQTEVAPDAPKRIGDVSKRMRAEIEEFLRVSVRLANKELEFEGWVDHDAAMRAIKKGG